MQMPFVFDRYRSVIDAQLKSVMAPYRSPLYDMMRYHLGWIDERGNDLTDASGKALRPTLCLLSCEATGSDIARALPAAAAVELIHNFSLIHDDIQDDDGERRHRPTVWKVWGKAQAINAGTAMKILANMSLARSSRDALPPEKQQRMLASLDDATLKLIEGQYLDIDFEQRSEIDIDDYLAMIKGKTAALIACSMELGVLSGTDDADTIQRFRDFGENLGIAFQIRDDILGIWGDPNMTGKPLGSDIRRKKKSLPVVFALSRAADRQRDAIFKMLQKEILADDDVETFLGILDDMHVRASVQEMADGYCDKARRKIREAGIEPGSRGDFEHILEFLSARNY
ncbi:MAG: hypothetical protein A2176_08020 [Spirochaetes bacterium RBG_13_51_14]|nr:MAG: hypothetical protein A2176_08020 [Spirochaetes bacterium RBG_13_51_14]